jgi:hypothetical protein
MPETSPEYGQFLAGLLAESLARRGLAPVTMAAMEPAGVAAVMEASGR